MEGNTPARRADRLMEKHWYAIHTFSGYENRIRTQIEHRVQVEGLRDKVSQVLIPQKKAVEIKNGKKTEMMRNIMPGYVFIEMEANDEVFSLVQKIQGVSMFLGAEYGEQPQPLTQAEVDGLLDNMEDRPDRPKTLISYQVNDQVKVIEGPFANFVGTVEQVDQEKGKLKVMVSIFGRPTSVELDVLQVESA